MNVCFRCSFRDFFVCDLCWLFIELVKFIKLFIEENFVFIWFKICNFFMWWNREYFVLCFLSNSLLGVWFLNWNILGR